MTQAARPVGTFSSIDLGLASRPRPGEIVSGDHGLARPLRNGLLIAVIDGLGHGDAAAAAARRATEVLETAPDEASLVGLLERCHPALRKTRGAVISLALLEPNASRLSWLGVGNVEAVLVRAASETSPRETLALRPGIVGHRLPPLLTATLPLLRGDLIVLATDGVRRGIAGELADAETAQQAAERLLASGATEADDALVLVARYREPMS